MNKCRIHCVQNCALSYSLLYQFAERSIFNANSVMLSKVITLTVYYAVFIYIVWHCLVCISQVCSKHTEKYDKTCHFCIVSFTFEVTRSDRWLCLSSIWGCVYAHLFNLQLENSRWPSDVSIHVMSIMSFDGVQSWILGSHMNISDKSIENDISRKL